MVNRFIAKQVRDRLFGGKALLLTGARQVGKTTLVDKLKHDFDNESIYLNCDEPDIRSLLTDATSTELKKLIGSNKLIIIDEGQRVANIGITVKLLVDNLPDRQIIVTGSSAFELSNKLKEPLTGRKFEFQLYPFSIKELADYHGLQEERRLLKNRLIYGMYPEIALSDNQQKELLLSLADSYLYKDILAWGGIKKPELLEKILTALALQLGQQVSYNELGQTVGADNETVVNYLNLLEKAFVIYKLSSFSKNLRNELKKSQKYYFYDNGIRNAVINNFTSLDQRQDKGNLWENFLLSERLKYLSETKRNRKRYFWRTKQQKEIDYIETEADKVFAWEFKWKTTGKKKFPASFTNAYSDASTKWVDSSNYEFFLGI